MTAALHISRWPGEVRAVLLAGDQPVDLIVDRVDRPIRVGEILVARVTKLLAGGAGAILADAAGDELFVPKAPKDWTQGALAVVQIRQDAHGGKLPAGRSGFVLEGRMVSLDPFRDGTGLSHRLSSGTQRAAVGALLQRLSQPGEFLLGRSWASADAGDEIAAEVESLRARAAALAAEGARAREPSRLSRAVPIDDLIKDAPPGVQVLDKDTPETEEAVASALEAAGNRQVNLASGASVTFDPTEALTAIDVDTAGALERRASGARLSDINREAGTEIARHLRLRAIGGLAVVDFAGDRKAAAAGRAALKKAVANDPARIEVGDITTLGLLDLSRQRGRRPLHDLLYQANGHIRRPDADAAMVLRYLEKEGRRVSTPIYLTVPPHIDTCLSRQPWQAVLDGLIATLGVPVTLDSDPSLPPDTLDLRAG
jgi:Ribonuclease G/E